MGLRAARLPLAHQSLPGYFALRRPSKRGEVTEWSIVAVSKTVVGLRLPWVRIPPSPPLAPAKALSRSGHGRIFQLFSGGYVGGAVNLRMPDKAGKRSLRADILRSRQLDPSWFRVAKFCFHSVFCGCLTVSDLSFVRLAMRLRSNCPTLVFADGHK